MIMASAPVAEPLTPRPDSPYYVSLARPEDHVAIEALSAGAERAEVAFPVTRDTLRWIVDDNPVGAGFVVLARSRRDDTLVGYLAFYAKRLMVWDSERCRAIPHTAYLYLTVYVAPTHRRLGAFLTMVRYGLDVVASLGCSFAFTVPNPRSAAGYRKAAFPRLGTVSFWASPRGWRGLPATLIGEGVATAFGERVEVVPSARFHVDHETLTTGVRPGSASVWGSRTLEELQWRFEGRPGVDYRLWDLRADGALVGYVVTRELRIRSLDTTVVCDAWLDPAHGAAMGRAMSVLRRRPAGSASQWLIAPCGGGAAGAVRTQVAAGMIPIPQRLLPQPVLVVGNALGTGEPTAWMRTGGLSQWFITPYDWDVF
jgi:GNAT superfamily N-acetyltransferase